MMYMGLWRVHAVSQIGNDKRNRDLNRFGCQDRSRLYNTYVRGLEMHKFAQPQDTLGFLC